MRLRILLGIALIPVIGLAAALRSDPVRDERGPKPVVFACLNGVSMSVWSAAYFNRLAAERGLRERAEARATIPSYREVPLRMRFALALDGFRLGDYRPQVINAADARGAELIVVIGTELPREVIVPDGVRAEFWQGFPPMREQYFPSRAALEQRVEALVARLVADEAS